MNRRMDEIVGRLGYYSYKQYLKSEHWQGLIAAYKADRCFCCKSRKELRLHHTTYDRVGKETEADLTTVCRECHHIIHCRVNEKKVGLEFAHFSLRRSKQGKTRRQRRSGKEKRKRDKNSTARFVECTRRQETNKANKQKK